MSRWRHSRFVQIIALTILFWTAADITNSGLCALEQEQTTPVAHSDLLSHFETLKSTTTPGTNAETSHVDDCFCCSHCVQFGVATVSIADSGPSLTVFVSVPAIPNTYGAPPFHPPIA